MAKIRVGFLVGKDTDIVEDIKYRRIGDQSFLKDMPDMYRVDPSSGEYLKNCAPGTTGIAHTDCAIAWYVHKHYPDIEVDIIFPEDITMKRLKSNLCNFVAGYDVINSVFEGPGRFKLMTRLFKKCNNLMPSWNVQEYIYYKSRYMQDCIKQGVPMAPTIFAYKGKRSPEKLLAEIKGRGWKTFVMKQSMMAFSLGFCKLKVEDCEKNPKILKDYFAEYPNPPEYVVQESIEGFTRNWETRCFWFNGKFLYAIANIAAVSHPSGKEVIVTGDDIPKEFLDNAKRIGRKALEVLPKNLVPGGGDCGQILIRTDVGCSDVPINDNVQGPIWNAKPRFFFLNEIEYGGTTYFSRHLKFDSMPMYGKLYAEKAREVAKVAAKHTSLAKPLGDKLKRTAAKKVQQQKKRSVAAETIPKTPTPTRKATKKTITKK